MGALLGPLPKHLRQRVTHARHRARFLRDEVHVARRSYIAPGVVIGRRTMINAPSHLDDCEIGAYCAIGGRLVVRSGRQPVERLGVPDVSGPGPGEGRVRIGNAVWIGDSVVICPGVSIGDGAIIGAGSVVTESVPAYAVAAGHPARVLRMRFPAAVVAELQGLDWWDWDDGRLRRARELFETDLTATGPGDLDRLLTQD